MFKFDKWKLLSLIELLLVCGLILYKQPIIQYVNNTDIVKTVGHISLDDSFEKIYTDVDNDIAYYRYPCNSHLLNIGDTVYTCNDDTVTVTATDVYGFYVTCEDSFYPGMSGTAIRNSNGQGVGYVSELLDNDTVYCIWR